MRRLCVRLLQRAREPWRQVRETQRPSTQAIPRPSRRTDSRRQLATHGQGIRHRPTSTRCSPVVEACGSLRWGAARLAANVSITEIENLLLGLVNACLGHEIALRHLAPGGHNWPLDAVRQVTR